MYDPASLPASVRASSAAKEAGQHPYLAHLLARQRELGYLTGHDVDVQGVDEEQARLLAAAYYGLITEVDHHIGRVIAYLRQTGEYDSTLIVFTVDHGEMLGDHWLYGKEGYFDQAYNIPLIIRDPRPEAAPARGSVADRFTEAVDVMPTIVDWLRLPVPVECDGSSLLPFLEGRQPGGWRREAHWEYDFRDIEGGLVEAALGLTGDQCTLNVIRDERYKYVHFTALPPLFFDLAADPHEFRDVAREPSYQNLVLEYAQRMLSWRMVHDERTMTNMFVTPSGLIERRSPRV
jgi:arylsulfatase A-like enzyme